eukprot:6172715-Pleurochrysis_carterae.AAC.1
MPIGGASIRAIQPVSPKAHNYTVRREAESPLDHMVAMRFGYQLKNTNKPCNDAQMPMRNMQMRMNDNQSRNLQSQTDPYDRGSLAWIARPRKSNILPMKTAMTL